MSYLIFRVPRAASPEFAHVKVVRGHAARRRLPARECRECEQWFDAKNLTDAERTEAMKSCRHRAKYGAPDTPDHFWSIGFPDTQECIQRGYTKKS